MQHSNVAAYRYPHLFKACLDKAQATGEKFNSDMFAKVIGSWPEEQRRVAENKFAAMDAA